MKPLLSVIDEKTKQSVTPTTAMFVEVFNQEAENINVEGFNPKLRKDEYEIKYDGKDLVIIVNYSVVKNDDQYFAFVSENREVGGYAKITEFPQINCIKNFQKNFCSNKNVIKRVRRNDEGVNVHNSLNRSWRRLVGTSDRESNNKYMERATRYYNNYRFFSGHESKLIIWPNKRYCGYKDNEIHIGFTMEKAGKHNLRQEIKDGSKALKQRMVAIALSIIKDLQQLHKKGMHCDIKPENIMISDKNKCKFVDFDLSIKHKDKPTPAGSPPFIAPELLEMGSVGILKMDAKYTIKSDIYSLGITFLQLFSWKRRCTVKTKEEIAGTLCKEDNELFKLVYDMTRVDPNNRLTLDKINNRLCTMQLFCTNGGTNDTLLCNNTLLEEYEPAYKKQYEEAACKREEECKRKQAKEDEKDMELKKQISPTKNCCNVQ